MKLDLARTAMAAAIALATLGLPAAPALAGATTGHWKDGTSYARYKKYEKHGYSHACHYDRQCRDRYWRHHRNDDLARKHNHGVTVKVR